MDYIKAVCQGTGTFKYLKAHAEMLDAVAATERMGVHVSVDDGCTIIGIPLDLMKVMKVFRFYAFHTDEEMSKLLELRKSPEHLEAEVADLRRRADKIESTIRPQPRD